MLQQYVPQQMPQEQPQQQQQPPQQQAPKCVGIVVHEAKTMDELNYIDPEEPCRKQVILSDENETVYVTRKNFKTGKPERKEYVLKETITVAPSNSEDMSKLTEALILVVNKLEQMQTGIEKTNGGISAMQSEINGLQGGLDGLQCEIGSLQNEVKGIKNTKLKVVEIQDEPATTKPVANKRRGTGGKFAKGEV